MTNEKYLKEMKVAEEKWLDDEVIRNISSDNPEWDMEGMEYRKVKALEIIAEELCKLNAKDTENKVVYKMKKAAMKINASIPK